MEKILVPQKIINDLDIVKLRDWVKFTEHNDGGIGFDAYHNRKNAEVQGFVICKGYDNEIFQDETLYYRLQEDNIIRKIKFKNINKLFTFYKR